MWGLTSYAIPPSAVGCTAVIRATPPWLFLPGSTRSRTSTIAPTSKEASGLFSPALSPAFSFSFESPSAPSGSAATATGTTAGSAIGAVTPGESAALLSIFASSPGTSSPVDGAAAIPSPGPAESVGDGSKSEVN